VFLKVWEVVATAAERYCMFQCKLTSSHGLVARHWSLTQQTWICIPLAPIWTVDGDREVTGPKFFSCTTNIPL